MQLSRSRAVELAFIVLLAAPVAAFLMTWDGRDRPGGPLQSVVIFVVAFVAIAFAGKVVGALVKRANNEKPRSNGGTPNKG